MRGNFSGFTRTSLATGDIFFVREQNIVWRSVMSLQKFPKFLLNFSEGDMRGENGHFYDFRSFRLNLADRRLLDSATPVSLTPKAFDVLAVLVERAGHLVEKEELMQLVWPNSFVEEANVARIVHTLRKKLGDDGNGNSFIETVPTKGYRFIADVSVEEVPKKNGIGATQSSNGLLATPEAGQIPAPLVADIKSESEPSAVLTRHSRWFRWAFALLGASIVMALAGWIGFGGRSFPAAVGLKFNAAMTSNKDAFFNYQEGKLLLEKRKREDQDKALEYFDKAIQLDPNFADAYAGRAVTKMWRFEKDKDQDDMAQARTAIDRALELSGSSSFANFALGRMKITYDWEFQKGEQACKKAIELDPNNQDAHFELAMLYSQFAREEEALAEIDTAIALAPTSFNKTRRALILYYARRYDEAIEESRQIGQDDPEFDFANGVIVRSSERKGDYDTALDAQIKLFTSQGIDAEKIEIMRAKYASDGWPGVLRFIIELTEESKKQKLGAGIGTGIGKGLVYIAGMYCQLGEYETAYKYLEEAFKQRNLWMIHQARDPRFDAMRNDARFQKMLKDVGLK